MKSTMFFHDHNLKPLCVKFLSDYYYSKLFVETLVKWFSLCIALSSFIPIVNVHILDFIVIVCCFID